ncbi:MAG: hypothetical protein DA443_09075 [Bacteroidetes bacterium]|nr:MAG: hypothetical protein DA443_09075 [Bacteroidota bacterium]
MKSHEIDYKIYGDDMQVVSIELDPNETVIAEAGSMNWMDRDIRFEAKMGDGMAFLHAGGTVVERELNNETLLIDTGCIVAFTRGLNYSIERAGNLKSMVFGGEGLFLATMQGVGKVYLQTLPFSRLADRILKHAPKAGGSAKGEGSVLGGVGRLLDGV